LAEFWTRFHFLRPELLWLWLPLGLGALALFVRARAASPWRGIIRPELLARLEAERRTPLHFGPEALVVALGLVGTFCAAGPCYRAQVQSGDPEQNPLIVVFELSRTMAKTDVSPSRAERARLELGTLLRARPTSSTALIVVAGTAHVLMPFTDDASALEPYVAVLAPDLMPVDGQAFGAAAKVIEDLAASSSVAPAVLLISDGLSREGGQTLRELADRKKLGLVALTVGEGDAEMTALEQSADEAIALSYAGRDVPRLLAAIASSRAEHVAPGDARFWQDEGPLWAWPLLLGLAFWFRRGFVLGSRTRSAAVITAALCLSGCVPWVEGIWLTPDQQGRLAFERGDYLDAAARFQDPTWKGLSFYAAERWDLAAAQFVAGDDAESLFYLGNAYAEGGKLQSALHAYEGALRKRPTFRKARENRDRIEHLLHSLQEDTDKADMARPDEGSDDAAGKLDPDALLKKPLPSSGTSAPHPASRAGEVQEAVWLQHLTTEPTAFLKRKLAAQAAGGAP